MTLTNQRGTSVLSKITTAASPIAIPTTVLGPTLIPLSFSVSKYLIRPAEDWKPPSFFFAIRLSIELRYITLGSGIPLWRIFTSAEAVGQIMSIGYSPISKNTINGTAGESVFYNMQIGHPIKCTGQK